MELHIKRFEELTTSELYEIFKARVAVFVVEQHCAYQEIDEKDKFSYHVFLEDNGSVKAYLRVIDKGAAFDSVSIGRVLTTERGNGLGHRILDEGIKTAKEKMNADKIIVEAQSYVKNFYAEHGFRQTSEEFSEDGIPHVQMTLTLR